MNLINQLKSLYMKNLQASTFSFRVVITIVALSLLCFGAKAQDASDSSASKVATSLVVHL
jgi:hypothetical protein